MTQFFVSVHLETDRELPDVLRLGAEIAQLTGIDHDVTLVSVGHTFDDSEEEWLEVPATLGETSP